MGENHERYSQMNQQAVYYSVIKATAAATAGGSLLVLFTLILTLTIITIITVTVATPLFVIFSPVLVPATIATLVTAAGIVTSCGLGVAAVRVMTWMYQCLNGKHPSGADQLDQASC